MPISPSKEAELALIIQAQNGDRNAFEELVLRHYSYIVNVVYRMCADQTLAEDATQEAFLRAWMKLPSYHPESSLRSWLCRIAINASLDVLRKKTEETFEPEKMQSFATHAPGPEAILEQKEQAAFIQQAMRSLPEGALRVLVLREYGELSYQEIAATLDIPIGTVMSRLNYARNRLRELLTKKMVEMEPEYA